MELKDYYEVLISSCIPQDDSQRKLCKENYTRLTSFIIPEDFSGEQFIIYKIIDRCYVKNSKLSWKYVEVLVQQNIKRFIRDEHVEIKALFPTLRASELDNPEKEIQVANDLMALIKATYEKYETREVDTETLNATIDMLQEFKHTEELKKMLLTANEILFKGKTIKMNGKDHYLVGKDAESYLLAEVAKISNKYTEQTNFINEITLESYSSFEYLEEHSRQGYTLVTNTGIDMIDSVIGGFYTTQVWGLAGMSGVGKSRFAYMLQYRTLTLFGKNCYFLGMEQHCAECEYYLASQHTWYMFGIYADDKSIKRHTDYMKRVANGTVLPQDKPYLDDEQVECIRKARLDLYENPSYGKIHLDNSFVPVEKMCPKFKAFNNTTMKIHMLTVDHMSILRSDGSLNNGVPWGQTEIVSYGMKELKVLAQEINCFVCAINQLTREQVKKILDGKSSDITGGANSSEFEHSSDGLLLIGTTEALDKVNQVFIDHNKARDSEKFGRLILNTNKGICKFELANGSAKPI